MHLYVVPSLHRNLELPKSPMLRENSFLTWRIHGDLTCGFNTRISRRVKSFDKRLRDVMHVVTERCEERGREIEREKKQNEHRGWKRKPGALVLSPSATTDRSLWRRIACRAVSLAHRKPNAAEGRREHRRKQPKRGHTVWTSRRRCC